ncbi:hypothetical protein EDC65_5027 [Stella humosa]|uniref:Uncharacterized protein n=1 Tax=Stella humosa TaxID=94 RepID=A0A3N1KPF6_9PROT|nr:hypothetical protein [Stella humosa]ROP81172.1 hypothetical protein EDC65_5027 [Stella humosa]BBK32518.1 hypothetical protein STHU_31520 [Stella humosa]
MPKGHWKDEVRVPNMIGKVATRVVVLAALAPAVVATAHAAELNFTFANHLTSETIRARIFHADQGQQDAGIAAGGHSVIYKPYTMAQGSNLMLAYFHSENGFAQYCHYAVSVDFTWSDWGWLKPQTGTYACSIMPTSSAPNKCQHSSTATAGGCNFSFMVER